MLYVRTRVGTLQRSTDTVIARDQSKALTAVRTSTAVYGLAQYKDRLLLIVDRR